MTGSSGPPARPKGDQSTQEDQTDARARRLGGEFVRGISRFRSFFGEPDFPAEPNRYHLYIAHNCPWCHRVIITRNLLGLRQTVSMDAAFPNRTDASNPFGANLWEFAPDRIASVTGGALPECTPDTASGQSFRLVKQVYQAQGSNESSVPILYDKKQSRIVSNESADIMRMLNANAAALGSTIENGDRQDLFPGDDPALCDSISNLNETIFTNINNGAYKAGFSSNQAVYARAFKNYFDTLGALEKLLASDRRPFLLGKALTEADVRLFPTLYRHDPIYYVRMKLNGARIMDYPYLWRWLCRIYEIEGVAQGSEMLHCRQGYFGRSWNGVIPLGPVIPMPYPEAYRHPELADL